jgi:hypothetical protein
VGWKTLGVDEAVDGRVMWTKEEWGVRIHFTRRLGAERAV